MPNMKANQYNTNIAKNEIVISAGQTTTDQIETFGTTNLAIQFPSNWTTANITFLGSLDLGVTYSPIALADANAIALLNVTAGEVRVIQPTWLAPFDLLKIVSSTPQVNDVTLYISLRAIR